MTPAKLEVISPNSCATSLIWGVVASRLAVFNFRTLSGVNVSVILAELKINSKKVISWVGIKIDFSGCITNYRLSNKVMVSAMLLTQELYSSDVTQV